MSAETASPVLGESLDRVRAKRARDAACGALRAEPRHALERVRPEGGHELGIRAGSWGRCRSASIEGAPRGVAAGCARPSSSTPPVRSRGWRGSASGWRSDSSVTPAPPRAPGSMGRRDRASVVGRTSRDPGETGLEDAHSETRGRDEADESMRSLVGLLDWLFECTSRVRGGTR